MRKTLLPILICLFTACAPQETYQVGHISTRLGDLYIWLYEEVPVHRQNFIDLAEAGYWDDYSFNRVIEGFVAQGGCPDTPEGFAYSIHLLEPEFRPHLRHVYGTFAAGRDNNPGKLSAGCQFYVVHDADGIPRLDDNYTIYGYVFDGITLNINLPSQPGSSIVGGRLIFIDYFEATPDATFTVVPEPTSLALLGLGGLLAARRRR